MRYPYFFFGGLIMTETLALTQKPSYALVKQGLQIIGGALFLALMAQVKIPLYFTPVPLTLQTLVAMLLGAKLGSTRGTLSLATYFAMITAGLPVLAGGAVNAAALVGPTGGYLVGMAIQAAMTGWVIQKGYNFFTTYFLIVLVSLVQLTLGACWLGTFVGYENMFVMGILPFLAGDALKCFAATAICKTCKF